MRRPGRRLYVWRILLPMLLALAAPALAAPAATAAEPAQLREARLAIAGMT